MSIPCAAGLGRWGMGIRLPQSPAFIVDERLGPAGWVVIYPSTESRIIYQKTSRPTFGKATTSVDEVEFAEARF